MDHIDLSKYFVEKGYRTGRPRCDEQKLLKVIPFAFMEHGISSLREIEKLCRNDIRYSTSKVQGWMNLRLFQAAVTGKAFNKNSTKNYKDIWND
ncbi:hypothetical protein [Sinanaerobacter sp. ZZT-01]|uniref:hypothetical protein n=1 Tax=Sinanaerobacter sp. ZZT-01 TaxID=3111540 RepID=UPI002D76B750|nr:hypothetical protein [Sinanaerobacter sp. ZZT-01]WRR94388.1 hypothetical protein U5921_04530 [Sinanaerobacter sp. ZZT-01]